MTSAILAPRMNELVSVDDMELDGATMQDQKNGLYMGIHKYQEVKDTTELRRYHFKVI